MRILATLGAVATLVAAAACVFVTETCACVTVPDVHDEQWLGVTALGDSADFIFTVTISKASVIGTGMTRLAGGGRGDLLVSGEYDNTTSSPKRLGIVGWGHGPSTWTRTTPRNDSLYGVIQLQPGTRPGDTLGLHLYRRR